VLIAGPHTRPGLTIGATVELAWRVILHDKSRSSDCDSLTFLYIWSWCGRACTGRVTPPTVGDDDATIAPAVVEPGGGAVARALGEAEVTALLGATAGVATIDPRADPDHPAAASYHLRVMSMSARILT
jgi:hypothetical protein